MVLMRSPGFRALLIRGSLALVALCGMMAGEAHARIFVGVGFPFFFPPVVVAPPVYYPPYYPSYPPPAAYAPPGNSFSYTPPGYVPRNAQPQSLSPPSDYSPSGYAPPGEGYGPSGGPMPAAAQACHAGAYVCPLIEDTPPGGACACPGHGGQRIRGQAD
jgi:hypothetical protein